MYLLNDNLTKGANILRITSGTRHTIIVLCKHVNYN